MPRVFGNAMPKSGSHLLIQILEGLAGIGPFVNPGLPPVNRGETNRKLTERQVLAAIRSMQPGDIRYGYLHCEEPWRSAIPGEGRAAIFVFRDPRDWIISQIFYAKGMHEGHLLHAHYNRLESMEARIDAAIRGVEEGELHAPGVVERYGHYLGWLETPGVLCLRFEDLILEREAAIGRILDYLEAFDFRPEVSRLEAIRSLAEAVDPQRSGTFRRGQPGEWREHFTAGNKRLFADLAAGLQDALGYGVAKG